MNKGVSGGNREGAPAWTVPLYVGGLLVTYVGERVFSTFESSTGRWLVTGAGVGAVLAATAARFVPTWQAGGERGRIERTLGILSLLGVFGLVVYSASTDWGLAQLGLLTATDEKRNTVRSLLDIGWVALILVSVLPTLFAEASLYPMRNSARLESRRVRAAATAGLTLALALIYGALFVYSATGAEVKADFSYFKTSEPSESTKKLIAGLNQPIKVVGFFPEVSPVRREVEGYLKKLAEGQPNLQIVIDDRYLNPKLAKDMKIVQDGVIVIQKGEAKRMVTVGTDMKDAAKSLKTLDRDFQERVYKLLRERRNLYMTVGHGEVNDEDKKTGGMGVEKSAGRTASVLKMILGKQNYTVKNLGLSQGLGTDVPDDADVVMVLGPTDPFTPEELSSLDRYAKRGGKLLLALDPDSISTDDIESDKSSGQKSDGLKSVSAEAPKPKAAPSAEAPKPKAAPSAEVDKAKPQDKAEKASKAEPAKEKKPPATGAVGSMEQLAAIVGIEFHPTVLANDKQFAQRRYNDSDKTLLYTNRFSSHASVSTLSQNSSRAAVLVAGAGSIARSQGSQAKVDIAVRAMSGTFDDENRNYRFDEGHEKRDSYGLAAAVSQPIDGNAPAPKKEEKPAEAKDAKKDIPNVAPPNEMRAFVISDADVISDLLMSDFRANQVLVVDALRWLGGEESYAGEVNSEEDVRIEHTQQKDLVWFYGTIFGAPALVLGLGLAYSQRGKRAQGGRRS